MANKQNVTKSSRQAPKAATQKDCSCSTPTRSHPTHRREDDSKDSFWQSGQFSQSDALTFTRRLTLEKNGIARSGTGFYRAEERPEDEDEDLDDEDEDFDDEDDDEDFDDEDEDEDFDDEDEDFDDEDEDEDFENEDAEEEKDQNGRRSEKGQINASRKVNQTQRITQPNVLKSKLAKPSTKKR